MDLHRTALAVAVPNAAFGVLEVLHTQPAQFSAPVDYVIEVAFALAMAATATALALMSTRVAGTARRAWQAASGGAAALTLSAVATAVVGHDALGPVFSLGLLGLVGGYLTAAVLDLRGRLAPRGAGAVLLVAFVASVVVQGTGAGGLVLAAGWLGLARLAAPSPVPAPVPAV